MASKIFVVPAAGGLVRDPNGGRVLPAEGATVTNDKYWRRRVKFGDVVLKVDPPAEPKPKPKPVAKAKGKTTETPSKKRAFEDLPR